MTSDKQKLIDIMFECGLTIANPKYKFQEKSRDETAEWILRQLNLCGFNVISVGSSWGVLLDD